jgi:hypothetical protein
LYAKLLAELAPQVKVFYGRFALDNTQQEEMLFAVDSKHASVFEAACGWIKRNEKFWQSWLPPDEFSCERGQYVVEGRSCQPCLQGSFSSVGTETACTLCAPGEQGALPALRSSFAAVQPSDWAVIGYCRPLCCRARKSRMQFVR